MDVTTRKVFHISNWLKKFLFFFWVNSYRVYIWERFDQFFSFKTIVMTIWDTYYDFPTYKKKKRFSSADFTSTKMNIKFNVSKRIWSNWTVNWKSKSTKCTALVVQLLLVQFHSSQMETKRIVVVKYYY